MRFLFALLLVWAVATSAVLIVARSLRGVSIPPGVAFWGTLVLMLVATYPIFFRLLRGYRLTESNATYKVLLAALLSCASYLVVMYATFMIAVLLFGE